MCNAEIEGKNSIVNICKQHNYNCNICNEHIEINTSMTFINGSKINSSDSDSRVIRSKTKIQSI